ncbi:MAG: C45 family autoproteolytic acyltransferase/hydrolase [Alphaproteobacteria bacterium]|nr:C45 family autoproteolytic acyltransferase/hydrolase [Alphaproteobacteria bacterium]
MKLKVLHTSGTHHDVGLAMGQQGKDALHNIIFKLPRFQHLKQHYADSEDLRDMMKRAEETFPQYCDELRGIADGAGTSYEDIFLWNCRGDFPKEIGCTVETAGCTDILIAPQGEQKNGIIAHNEDGNTKLHGHCFVVHGHFNAKAEPHEIESFSYPGMLMGHTFAANSHGLALTINHLPWHTKTNGIPRHFICRAILDCKTKEEAVNIIKTHISSGSFNYNIGQAGENTILAIEAPSGTHKTVQVTDRFAHANHCIQPEQASLYPPVNGSTAHRQARADALLPHITPTEQDALGILFDKGDKDLPILRDASGPDTGVATLATAVFQLKQKSVSWTFYDSQTQQPVHKGQFSIP